MPEDSIVTLQRRLLSSNSIKLPVGDNYKSIKLTILSKLKQNSRYADIHDTEEIFNKVTESYQQN